MNQEQLLDGGYLPAALIRIGIRRQLRERVRQIATANQEDAIRKKLEYVRNASEKPIALHTQTANSQHYEVETGILQSCLGPRMKYSGCLYPKGQETLGQAEVEMLRLYVERGQLQDGMRILDLGCGWGSASLFFAEIFPKARITAFSNSKTQKSYIDEQAKRLGLSNIIVVTGDVVTYEFESDSFDRVISIELFEHMKNYKALMKKLSKCLVSNGKLFVHIFTHCDTPYDFEDGWMAEHFFTGGTMPSADLLLYFQSDLSLENQWWVSGTHYGQTCEDWLQRLNTNKAAVWPFLEAMYGSEHAAKWFYRWQIFYMACAELFKFQNGNVWGVSHYLFSKG